MTIHWVIFHVGGNPVYVNPEHIVSFHGASRGSIVRTVDGRDWTVDEAVEGIKTALKLARMIDVRE